MQGRGCKLIKNGPCSSLFAAKHYTTMQANAAELSWAELQQARSLPASNNVILNSSKYRHPQKGRVKCTTFFHHQGHRVLGRHPPLLPKILNFFRPGTVTLKTILSTCYETQHGLQHLINFFHPSSHQTCQVPDNGVCTIKYERFVKMALKTWCAHIPQYPHQSMRSH